MTNYTGIRAISGAYGTLWWNNEPVAEVSKFEATVTADREDVQLGLSKDSKMVSLTGSGTLTLHKFFSKAAPLLEAWNSGHDERVMLIAAHKDPDAIGGKEERIVINNVWFNDLPVFQFERGAVINEEFSFGFTPEDAVFESTITN